MSYYPQKRNTSPGSRKLKIPTRSSTGTFAPSSSDPYGEYSRSPVRETYTSPRTSTSGGVIPISTETFVSYPSSSSSRSTDTYSGRPRRATLTGTSPPSSLALRPRQTAVYQESAIDRPRSPLQRTYERDVFVKPSQTVKREHKRLYSVDDNKSAQLIAETETDPRDSRYFDAERDRGRERRGYHLTGSSRPRNIDDAGGYSYYSDPATMYLDTEPRWRRRTSIDKSRPTGFVDPFAPFGPPTRSSTLREGLPPTSRGLDRVNDIMRGGSVRDLPRANSKERRYTYDPYRNDNVYEIPRRSSSATREPVIINVQRPEESYYRNEDDRRDPRLRDEFQDEEVESRGFGIRSVSSDPPRDYEPRHASHDNRAPPPPGGAYSSGLSSSAAPSVMPNPKDYMPPPPAEARHASRDEGRYGSYEDGRHRNHEEGRHGSREEGRHASYDEGRHGSREEGRHASYDEGKRASKDPVYERVDRERDRDFDRRRDDRKDAMSSAAPAVAAGAAGVAAGAAIDKARHDRDTDRRRHDSDEEEHRHGTRVRNPNDREDAREREYSERDRREDEARKRDRYKDPNDVGPDEDYHRRVEQAQLDLARQTSRESQKSDDEGRRKLRKERSRDTENDRPVNGDEVAVMPTRDIVYRDRESSLKDDVSNSNRALVAEPEALAGATAATSTALVLSSSFPDDGSRHRESVSNSSSDDDGHRSHSKKARGVRIVEPAKAETPPPPPIKSILKKPKEKFPEDPHPIKEGALPLPNSKSARDKSIPPGARWTKISRELVNPEALDQARLRYEERADCVIVLRVLTRKDIEELAARTRKIREERERPHGRDKERGEPDERRGRHGHRRHHAADDEPAEADYDAQRDGRRAIEDGKRGRREHDKERRDDDVYMSGALR